MGQSLGRLDLHCGPVALTCRSNVGNETISSNVGMNPELIPFASG
jgi:hypothetical protein